MKIMAEYQIPKEYYFRLHHVRPRFKGDIENVLIYVAEEIARVGEKATDDFVADVNAALFRYPGNAHRELKTINNWRTEISALFGFIQHTEITDKPGRRAIELANNQDLVECFKVFLYNFQYPGAHIKPRAVLEQIEQGIKFKPAQYVLQLLRYANREGENSIGITKPEACHCIFNDLRVTRDHEGVESTWKRISDNRKNKMTYDQTGDVVRYAGDILDYMEIANLLKTYDSRTYYLNTLEEESIIKFCESNEWFDGYDNMIQSRHGSLETVKACSDGWFAYVNRDMKSTDFSTDILAYIANDAEELKQLKENATVTKVILLVKLIYRDKILGEGLKATVTNLAEIREYGKNTNLINYKLTMGEWKEALYVMSKHQIIEVPGAIQNVEDETPIYIYSTINLYCGSMDITALIKEYQEDQYAEEEITEEVFEQEIQEEAEGGVEDERETIEENIY